MPRPREGWKIRRKKGRLTWDVVFTHNGPVERSTGRQDPTEAAEQAALIYADYVQRVPERQQRPVARGDTPPLEELVTRWLTHDTTIGKRTVDTWTVYGGHWRARWESLAFITEASVRDYRNARLRVVQADTVRKELSALKRFLEWCSDNGYLQREISVCTVPRKATGQRYEKRRRRSAPEISPAEAEAIIAALPVWAGMGGRKHNIEAVKKKFPLRARFLVAYETGLRPSFLDELRCPEHYRKGAAEIRIPLEHDKNLYERPVPLTARARAALDEVCPDIGLIFGKHDYRIQIGRAAAAVLSPAKAEIFCGAHFRSAQATHTLEATGNIPGAMHLFGWTQVATASKYTKPSQRAAEAVIEEREAKRRKQDAARARAKR